MSMPRPIDKPNGLTESESRVIAGLVHQLRDVHPPAAGLWQKWSPLAFGAVIAVFGAFLNSSLNDARDAQKAANARIDAIDARSKQNEIDVDRIDRERTARIAASDARFETLERRTLPIDGMLKDIGRAETAVAAHTEMLGKGREERLADTGKIIDGMATQKTEIALLRQELQQLRQALEARGRRADPGPFGENQIWRGPPYPPILKVRARIGADAALRVAERR